jgi:hypothetical protein
MNEDSADIILGPPIKRIETTPEELAENATWSCRELPSDSTAVITGGCDS